MLLDYLREDPRALHVLTYVLGASPFLSEILIRTPEYFHWLVSQVERSAPDRQDHEEELVSAFATVDDPLDALNMLRRWKRRETLRIGTRDLLRQETVQSVTAQLSDLASVAVDFALAIVMRQRLDAAGRTEVPGSFSVIGVGALGGREMTYASDIELLCVFEPAAAAPDGAQDFFADVGHHLLRALSDESVEEPLYRVVAPSWLQMNERDKACSLAAFQTHFGRSNDTAERLAMTRARAVAGDADLGERFMEACHAFVYRRQPNGRVDPDQGQAELDFEVFTKIWQLRHGIDHAALRDADAFQVLDVMRRVGLIPEQSCRELDRAYVFLRAAEHRRQLGLVEDLHGQIEASRDRVREICRSLKLS
jgi:glutamate-ammonia-ligase adenylyltransferase